MIEFTCSGSPFEIGYKHGATAKKEILGSLGFYTEYYQRTAKMDWATASTVAERFIPMLEKDWPEYIEEMKGIAEGADLPFLSILAMNVRSEISMGFASDGCTSFAWKTDEISLLGQNWDWEVPQQDNLIHLNIKQTSKPSVSQITEAGIIGKIGINSNGVGVCLNAIRVRGVDFNRLPVHIANRVILDSTSKAEAIEKLEKTGVASAAHYLIGDITGSTSVETSSLDLIKIEMEEGQIAHSNHFVVAHNEDVPSVTYSLHDSGQRVIRARELLLTAREMEKPPTVRTIEKMLEDEQGLPAAINRMPGEDSRSATLFGIVMDLGKRLATVRVGRPTQCKGSILLDPTNL